MFKEMTLSKGFFLCFPSNRKITEQENHEMGTLLLWVFSSSLLQYHYPVQQTKAQSRLSFLASSLPSGCFSYAPLIGGSLEFTGFFLLTMPTPPQAQMHSPGTDQLLLRCLGPSLGLDPTLSISHHASWHWLSGCQTMTPMYSPSTLSSIRNSIHDIR